MRASTSVVVGVLLEDVCLSLCSTLLHTRRSMQTRAVITSLLACVVLSYASLLRVRTERVSPFLVRVPRLRAVKKKTQKLVC